MSFNNHLMLKEPLVMMHKFYRACIFSLTVALSVSSSVLASDQQQFTQENNYNVTTVRLANNVAQDTVDNNAASALASSATTSDTSAFIRSKKVAKQMFLYSEAELIIAIVHRANAGDKEAIDQIIDLKFRGVHWFEGATLEALNTLTFFAIIDDFGRCCKNLSSYALKWKVRRV